MVPNLAIKKINNTEITNIILIILMFWYKWIMKIKHHKIMIFILWILYNVIWRVIVYNISNKIVKQFLIV